MLSEISLERVHGESCALVFSRIDDFNEEIDHSREAKRPPNLPEDVRREQKHVGVSTQHGIYRALRAFLNYQWKKAHAVSFNPVYMVELEPEVHVAPLTWSPEQVARFLDFHADHRLIFLWRLALLRGFRRGELCGMGDSDSEDEEGSISVNVALLEIGGKLWRKPKSKAGACVVGLDEGSVEEGRAHRTRRKREHLAAGAAWTDSGLMFTNELGEPLRPDEVSAEFKELSVRAGLPVIKFHATRHTAATLAFEAGVDVRIVSDQLGHSTTTITRDTYQHVRRVQHRDAAEKVLALPGA
jgi:integrase